MDSNLQALKGNRPIAGPVLAGIAALHLGTTPVFYGAAWAKIIREGVLDAVTTPATEAAFWWVAAGWGIALVAVLGWFYERRAGRLPLVFAILLLAFTAFHVVLMPASGFWLFLIPAVIISVQAARARRAASPVSSAAAATAEPAATTGSTG